MHQAIKEPTQCNRELYEKKLKSEMTQRILMRPKPCGKAANQALLNRQEEMKQLQEQYAKKEHESKLLWKRPTSSRAASVPAESPLTADLESGMDQCLACKKEESRQRAEQRVASAQGGIESWQDYEANYQDDDPLALKSLELASVKAPNR